jgi:hypothetical protein
MATEQVLAREDLLYPTVILPGALPDFAHYDFYLSIFGNGSGALASCTCDRMKAMTN